MTSTSSSTAPPTLEHYQRAFIEWWGLHQLLHCSQATKGLPLPDDRPYHWSTLQSMDDETVVLLFTLHCDHQLPYPIWRWLMANIGSMRTYHRHTVLRYQMTAQYKRKHVTSNGYSFWGTAD